MNTNTLTRFAILILITLTLQGCGIAALVAASALVGKNSNEIRMQFQQLNMERELLELEPVTWDQFRRGQYPGAEEPSIGPAPTDGGSRGGPPSRK